MINFKQNKSFAGVYLKKKMVFLIKNQERCRRVDSSVKDVTAREGCQTIDTHQLGKAW